MKKSSACIDCKSREEIINVETLTCEGCGDMSFECQSHKHSRPEPDSVETGLRLDHILPHLKEEELSMIHWALSISSKPK